MTGPAPHVRAFPSIPGVWRGRTIAKVDAETTGFASLDSLLPGNGWPIGALTELVPLVEGIGELRLLMPVLKRIVAQDQRVILIKPPHLPYAPALTREGLPLSHLVWIDAASDEDARWACEQALNEQAAGAVLLWTSTQKEIALRRLQLAAHESRALLFAYRPYSALRNPSPASVRLALHPAAGGMRVEVLKAKGGRAGSSALCTLRTAA